MTIIEKISCVRNIILFRRLNGSDHGDRAGDSPVRSTCLSGSAPRRSGSPLAYARFFRAVLRATGHRVSGTAGHASLRLLLSIPQGENRRIVYDTRGWIVRFLPFSSLSPFFSPFFFPRGLIVSRDGSLRRREIGVSRNSSGILAALGLETGRLGREESVSSGLPDTNRAYRSNSSSLRVNPFTTHRHVYRSKLSVHAAGAGRPYVAFRLRRGGGSLERCQRVSSIRRDLSERNVFPQSPVPPSKLGKSGLARARASG